MPLVRADAPYLPWRDPCEATRLLRYALHRQGFTHTYQSNGNGMSVLSVLTDLTVWCKSGSFIWREDGCEISHPADDPVGAARMISQHYRRPAAEDDSEVMDFAPTDSLRD
ncbi:hypothetical protein Plo01_41630 [Planobispora longispora]|uniref:Uncharacterized protein n=2 Tax=Planobispora longispora TaxID=28887 RepID=A0A8J3W5Q9_9ACTN|nr:hypothetical protein GCM10020093_103180 [Planobispora longispora]GIH77734.1 hypothetical protein Plo01_41630 [Planobispora longispora]